MPSVGRLLTTTHRGLDPDNRRQVWDVLNRFKQNRVLWLTTHSLDEADVLCTELVILANGRKCAEGTPLALKSRFGSGHKVTLTFAPDREAEAVQFMERQFPGSLLLSEFAEKKQYLVAKSTALASEIIRVMESEASASGIFDWGCQQASLEDVFLNVIDEDEQQNNNRDE